MKMNRIIFTFAAIVLAASCVPTPEIEFGIDTDKIEIGPAGGHKLPAGWHSTHLKHRR